MNVMLLAAGEGTRLRPFTNQLPKPAIPFLNIPLAAHALGFLHDLSIRNLVVNTYHLPNKIHDLFNRLPHGAEHLIFSDEVGEILGGGGGLMKAKKHFIGGGDFLLMNADEIILPQDSAILEKAIAHHKSTNAIATLLVMKHHGVGTQFGGVWTDQKNSIVGFGKTSVPGSSRAWHFVGVQILSEKIFNYLPEQGVSNILMDGIMKALADGKIAQAFPFECSWFETGNPNDFLEATQHCLEILSGKDSPERSALQRTLNQFSSTQLIQQNLPGAILYFSKDAQISTNSTYQGVVCVGAGSTIKDNCDLKNVIIGPGVQVTAGTKAANTMLL
ncbi:MAG: sugar phosphate nucleotidyltransferase [Bacillota bacterium]